MPKIVQVTYRKGPVVALVPKQHYAEVLSSLLSDSEQAHLSLTTDTITSHQAGRAFNAFTNQLLPRLHDGKSWTVLVVTSHGFPVGAIFPWSVWERYLAITQAEWLPDAVEDHPEDARVLAIVPARNRLRYLPEQAEVYQVEGYGWTIQLAPLNRRAPEHRVQLHLFGLTILLWPRRLWQPVFPHMHRTQLEKIS